MTEAQMSVVAAVALAIMGASDLLRRQSTGVIAVALLSIEITAIAVGLGFLFARARMWEKRRQKRK